MRLDSDSVWNISFEQLDILKAAERLSNNHVYIPISLLRSRSKPTNRFNELARELTERKFLTYKDKMYKLSISGQDCLAINALRLRGLQAMGSPIGIGKESDIFYGEYKGAKVAIKVHRLGRTSFRRVEERNLKDTKSWFAMNCESCKREAELLHKFCLLDVPQLLDVERHMLVMKLLNYAPLYQMKVENPAIISTKIFEFIKKLWDCGYVHGDLNEFNIMVRKDRIKVLDFPQCVAKTDPKALAYLKRDIECVHNFFMRKNRFVCDDSILLPVINEAGIMNNYEL